LNTNLHILIETFVRIPLEHNPYVHDLSMNPVDNELVPEQVASFVPDQKPHSSINNLYATTNKSSFYFIRN
jgi:hypothetical protein